MARFHRNKRIDILLKTMTYLNGYNLMIVGEGKEKNTMIYCKKAWLEEKYFSIEWTNNISKPKLS